MEDLKLCRNQNALVTRLREIAKSESGKRRNNARKIAGGPRVAAHLRSLIQSVCRWALIGYPDDITVNPANGIWRRTVPDKTAAQCLGFEEIRAVWRACETLATVRHLSRQARGARPCQQHQARKHAHVPQGSGAIQRPSPARSPRRYSPRQA
jgi:hypothetical protein